MVSMKVRKKQMQKIQKKRGLFSVISPFLIYYGVAMAVELAAMIILLQPKMPEMMQLDPKLVTAQYLMENYMSYVVEEYMKYLSVITIIVAACVIPFFLIQFRNDRNYEKMYGMPAREKTVLWKYIVIVGIAIPLAIASTNILTLSNITASDAYRQTSALLYDAGFGVQLLGYGLVVPIAEELMFRGLIYKRLMYLGGRKRAMVFSAVIFGLYHGNLAQTIYGFAVGLLAAYLYEKYGSIKAPVLLHAVMNLTSVIATEYEVFSWIFHDVVRVAVVTALCAAMASGMYVLMQRIFSDSEEKKEKKEDVPATE